MSPQEWAAVAPDGWRFVPISARDKAAGFFTKIECTAASVEVEAQEDAIAVARKLGRKLDIVGTGPLQANHVPMVDNLVILDGNQEGAIVGHVERRFRGGYYGAKEGPLAVL